MPGDELLTVRRRPAWQRWPVAAMAVGAVLATAGGAGLLLTRRADVSIEPGLSFPLAAALVALGMLLSCCGLGYYVLAPGFGGPTAAWQDVGSHRLVLGSTLLVILLSYLGPVVHLLFRPIEGLCSVSGFLTAALSVDAALIGVTYLRFVRPGVLTLDDLGLRRGRLVRDLRTGVLVGVAVLVASAAMQGVLDRFGVRQTQLQDFQCIRDLPPAGFLAVALAGGVMAPIAEELFFRGFVFRSYIRTRGPLAAYLGSSLLFAALHFNLPALLPILALAATLCWAYQRTGSIVPGVVGHALNNMVAFAALYFLNAGP